MMPLLPSNARLWHIADSCHEAAKQPLAKQHLLAAFVDQGPRIARDSPPLPVQTSLPRGILECQPFQPACRHDHALQSV